MKIKNIFFNGEDLNISENIIAEEILLEQNPINHRIYDKSTCVIMGGIHP